MVSLSANTLLYASEAGKEGGDIFLICTASPGHQVLAANKQKALLPAAPLLCSWRSEARICPPGILPDRLGLQASQMCLEGQLNLKCGDQTLFCSLQYLYDKLNAFDSFAEKSAETNRLF